MDQKEITNETPIMTLSVAADLLGIHQRTIMLYEFEKLIHPKRTPTKRRMFSHKDISRIKFIMFLTRKKGVNLAGIRYIFKLIEKAETNGLLLKREIFPDFKED